MDQEKGMGEDQDKGHCLRLCSLHCHAFGSGTISLLPYARARLHAFAANELPPLSAPGHVEHRNGQDMVDVLANRVFSRSYSCRPGVSGCAMLVRMLWVLPANEPLPLCLDLQVRLRLQSKVDCSQPSRVNEPSIEKPVLRPALRA